MPDQSTEQLTDEMHTFDATRKLTPEEVVWFAEHFDCGEKPCVVSTLCRRLAEARRENERLREERDLAVAHDRQPYPTACAYDRVCEARTRWQNRAEKAEAKNERLRGMVERIVAWCDNDMAGIVWDRGPVGEGWGSKEQHAMWQAARDLLANSKGEA